MLKKIMFLMTLSTISVFARTLTLDEAINLALENGKEIKVAEKTLEIGKLDVKAAFKTAMPSVVYTGQYQVGEETRDNLGKDRKGSSKTGYTQSIGITQPIYQGGAVLSALKGAKLFASNDLLDFIETKSKNRLNIVELYSRVIQNMRNLDALSFSKKQLDATYEKQKAQLDMRIITKTDILKTEFNLLEIESQMIGTKNNIAIDMNDIKKKLNIPSSENLTLVPFSVPESLTSGIDFNRDLNTVKFESVKALKAKNNVELAGVNKVVARSAMLPTVNGFGKYGTFTEETNFNDTTSKAEWRAGVSVNWNVFQFGKDYDKYKASKIEVEKEEINKSISEDNIEISLTTAYLELIRLEKVRDSKYKAMLAAQENFKLDTERYNVGLISTVDYLLSETQMRDSMVSYNGTLNDYYVAFEKYRALLV
ncbi:MAG: TolC family protein [Fusobacteriaceae bacterium]